MEAKADLVPLSDGAGEVIAAGSKVREFKPGDLVCTHMVHSGSFPYHITSTDTEAVNFNHICAGLGQALDGTLRQYGIFHYSCLVPMPSNIDFRAASTLPCSALTAWNGLFGIPGKLPKAGDIVVTQGTGGVSVAALQFAVAAGAQVLATTSSEAKAKRLRELGATNVINYRTTPKWGEEIRKLTPYGRGADFVVDIGGITTLGESLKAVRVDGVVVVAGLVGGDEAAEPPSIMETMWKVCTLRGVILGSRAQFREMNEFIQDHKIKPAYDERVFSWLEAKGAFQYVDDQKHFAKAIIDIP